MFMRLSTAFFKQSVRPLSLVVLCTGELWILLVLFCHSYLSAAEAYTVPRQSLVSQQRNADVLLRDDTTLLMNNIFDGSQIYLLLADVGASNGAHKLFEVCTSMSHELHEFH